MARAGRPSKFTEETRRKAAPAPEGPASEIRIKVPHRYSPRSYQVPVWNAVAAGTKRAVLVWARRLGKDKSCLNLVISKMCERIGLYIYLYPFAVQARRALWNGIGLDGMRFMDHFPEELIFDRNETEMKIVLRAPGGGPGSIFQIVGADNFDSLRSTNPIFVILSEYADMDPRAWTTIRPILRENGGTAIFIFTPRGANHAKQLWDMARAHPDQWFSQMVTIESARRDAPGEDGGLIVTHDEYLEEIAQGMPQEEADQEYLCSFQGSTIGSYYGAMLERHKDNVREVPWNPALPVFTAWDLGLDDETCIFFAQLPHGPEGPIHIIEFHRDRQKGIAEYVSLVKERPYSYGLHVLPHDGALMVSALEDLGMRPTISLPKTQSVTNDISRVRAMLPRTFWNRSKAMDGHAALVNYRKEFNPQTNTYSEHPKHDWSSHAADAFRMLAVALAENHLDDPDHADRQRYKTADNSGWTGYHSLDAVPDDPDDGDHEAEDSYVPWDRSRFRY